MDAIVTPSNIPQHYRVFEQALKEFKEIKRDEIDSFLYVSVPKKQENRFNIVKYPHYRLNRQGSKVLVEVDWDNVEEIPKEQLDIQHKYSDIANSALLPNFLNDGFKETYTLFKNPTLGFFAPAESYGPMGRGEEEANSWNYWSISTRGEAVIIQRPLR